MHAAKLRIYLYSSFFGTTFLEVVCVSKTCTIHQTETEFNGYQNLLNQAS